MTESRRCPLCTETYTDRTDLRVHLEVEHRKSEVVSHLVDGYVEDDPLSSESEQSTVDEERPTPPA